MESIYEPGTTVQIAYTGYTVEAKVLEYEPMGRYGRQRGWYKVEQITDYEDQPEGERPVYEAAEEFISLPGEPLKAPPFSSLWFALERAKLDKERQ